jgi:hypothetical protein
MQSRPRNLAQYLTREKAAAELELSPSSIRRMISTKQLPSILATKAEIGQRHGSQKN